MKLKNRLLEKLALLLFVAALVNTTTTTITNNLGNFRSLKMKTLNDQNNDFSESEAKNLAFFSNLIHCAAQPIKQCKKCFKPNKETVLHYFFQTFRMSKNEYRMMIHYNDNTEEVIISFSGPPVTNWSYINKVYKDGFKNLYKRKEKVEKEFSFVFYRKFRSLLAEKIKKLKDSGRGGFKFIFTGYSAGAPLAILSGVDMVLSKILNKKKNFVSVYTFGGLRVGDEEFGKLVNSNINLFKVVNADDFVVKIPHCYFTKKNDTWQCFNDDITKKFILQKGFPLAKYFVGYSKDAKEQHDKSIKNHKGEASKGKDTKKSRKSRKSDKSVKSVKSVNKLKKKKEALKKKIDILHKKVEKLKKKSKKSKKVSDRVAKLLKRLRERKKRFLKVKKSIKVLRHSLKLKHKRKLKDHNNDKKAKDHKKKGEKSKRTKKGNKDDKDDDKKEDHKDHKKDDKKIVTPLLSQQKNLKSLLTKWDDKSEDEKKKALQTLLHKNKEAISKIKTGKEMGHHHRNHHHKAKTITFTKGEIDKDFKNYEKYIKHSQTFGTTYFVKEKKSSKCSFNSYNKVPKCEAEFKSPSSFKSKVHDTYYGYKFNTCNK